MNKHVAVLLAGAALLTTVGFSSAASADPTHMKDSKPALTAPKATPMVVRTGLAPRFDPMAHRSAEHRVTVGPVRARTQVPSRTSTPTAGDRAAR